MTHAQSSRAVFVYLAKREYKSLQREHAIAKRDLNRYRSGICKSVSWSIYNVIRARYLKAMAQLRAAMKVAV